MSHAVEVEFPQSLKRHSAPIRSEAATLEQLFRELSLSDPATFGPLFENVDGLYRARRFVVLFVNQEIFFEHNTDLKSGDRIELALAIAGG